VLECVSKQSYFLIEAPASENPLQLKDGLPETFELQPNAVYHTRIEQKGGRGNIVLSGHSSFLKDLWVRFTNQEMNQHYTVRPHFLFDVGQASQNFQLDN
jgi:hypothetical protein